MPIPAINKLSSDPILIGGPSGRKYSSLPLEVFSRQDRPRAEPGWGPSGQRNVVRDVQKIWPHQKKTCENPSEHGSSNFTGFRIWLGHTHEVSSKLIPSTNHWAFGELAVTACSDWPSSYWLPLRNCNDILRHPTSKHATNVERKTQPCQCLTSSGDLSFFSAQKIATLNNSGPTANSVLISEARCLILSQLGLFDSCWNEKSVYVLCVYENIYNYDCCLPFNTGWNCSVFHFKLQPTATALSSSLPACDHIVLSILVWMLNTACSTASALFM